ncbi:Alanine--tRNA ligase, mitochondrial [Lamellibrachia satsuma]|nr:Alanine--tRNA ligase, mitochondrial [Lamellibrachia satsuma]
MGLEAVTAVLQGTISNYNTDLFKPLFDHIHQTCGAPVYLGHTGATDQAGIDTYCTIADHARKLTVAISDGLRPGRGVTKCGGLFIDMRSRHTGY